MWIKHKRPWEPPESEATPEAVWLARRRIIKTLGIGAGALGLDVSLAPGAARASFLSGFLEPGLQGDPKAVIIPKVPWSGQFPAKRNKAFKLGRGLTPEAVNATYNNFFEFGSNKTIWPEAQSLSISPWRITIDGMVKKKMTLGIDELIHRMPLEERLYRHRCVEAWSMTIPWTGFPMSGLVKLAEPTSDARYVRMVTFMEPDIASSQRQTWNPWPYVEGLTMAEANNELAFLVVGTYGHAALKQHGAPLRLAVPWKYGFKSIKSIVRFTFTDKQPVSFWQALQGNEYGFWANVNPKVPHPRWSQATERIIQSGKRVPTQIYNGYGEQVAYLYKNMHLPDTVLFR